MIEPAGVSFAHDCIGWRVICAEIEPAGVSFAHDCTGGRVICAEMNRIDRRVTCA